MKTEIMGYTDIHTHMLPGVDDGAENMDMSLKMLRTAYENGINQMILTPHNKPARHNASRNKMQTLVLQLQAEAEKEGIYIKLYIGNELYYRSDLLDLLESKRACTMAESAYVLVEFGPMDDFEYIRNGIYSILAGGYYPILAHTERYKNICADIKYADELYKMGCYIQVNSGSIMGKAGHREKLFSRRLLKEQLVHFVATDAHNHMERSPQMASCARYIERKYGNDYVRQLLSENPAYIIADKYI